MDKQENHTASKKAGMTPAPLVLSSASAEQHNKYKKIFDTLTNPVFITSHYAHVWELNQAAREFTNYTSATHENTSLFRLLPDSLKSHVVMFFSALMINEKKNTTAEIEYSDTRSHHHFEITAQPILFEGEQAYMIVINDIKEKKIFEKKIIEAIIDAEERERKQFALDLHDELGPFLSGIKLYINELGYNDMDKNKRNHIIQYLNTMADEAIQTTKAISNKLMPNVLQDYGLIKAIRTFSQKVDPFNKIQIHIHCYDAEARYEEKAEIILYRILIELINNTIKHAQANTITISIEEHHKNLKVKYKDDGIGFDLDKELASLKGMGLMSLLSRLTIISGHYSFDSKPGQGMSLTIKVALP